MDHTGDRLLVNPPLPSGSDIFQKVMGELGPQQPPVTETLHPEPRPVARRRSTHVHAHYVTETVIEEGRPKVQVKAVAEPEGCKDSHGNDSSDQILHGRCHCYFVRKGNVTGLADQQCHHEHRNQVYPISGSASSSTPHTSHQPSSPRTAAGKLSGAATDSASSPGGSPAAQRKSQQQLRSHLLTTGEDRFRARSNSDATGLNNLSSPRRLPAVSSTPGFPAAGRHPAHGKTSEPILASLATAGGRRRSPDRRSSSFHHSDSVDDVDSSLRAGSNNPSPHVAARESDVYPSVGSPRRKLSTHAVQTDQLHFLYDQFLSNAHAHPTSDSSVISGGRARASSTLQ